jgi:hypothetical protein
MISERLAEKSGISRFQKIRQEAYDTLDKNNQLRCHPEPFSGIVGVVNLMKVDTIKKAKSRDSVTD